MNMIRSLISLSIKSTFPEELRPRVWIWMCQVEKYSDWRPYELYDELKWTESSYDDQIRLDVERTLPGVKYFKGRKQKKKMKKKIESNKSIEVGEIDLTENMGEG